MLSDAFLLLIASLQIQPMNGRREKKAFFPRRLTLNRMNLTNQTMYHILQACGYGWERVEQIFSDATTAIINMTMNQFYIHTMPETRSWPQAIQILRCWFPRVHPAIVLYSLQGDWNSEAGRGVQCVVSKFRMCFRAWESERDSGEGGGIDMSGVGGQWTKSGELDYIRFSLSGSVPYKSPIS